METAATIAKINKALAEYYDKHGNSTYYDGAEEGKFKAFCDDNGFEDKDVVQELKQDPDDCVILEFDEEFPFDPPIDDENERTNALFKLLTDIVYGNEELGEIDKMLKKCKEMVHPTPIQLITKTAKNSSRETAKEIYRKQLYGTLGEAGLKDETLFEFLCVSFDNNNYPFLSNLVDSFIRDRITYRYEGNIKAYNALDWAETNPFIRNVVQSQHERGRRLTSAVKSYCSRICPKLQFSPFHKIKDSIREISIYVSIATRFIYNLVEQQKRIPPFQVDVIIALKGTLNAQKQLKPKFDHDDDEEEEEENDEIEEKMNDENDFIGNIEKKLKHENLCYSKTEISNSAEDDNLPAIISAMSRFMFSSYGKFRSVLRKNKHINDYDDTKNDESSTTKSFLGYPHHSRFCCFIDRRISKDAKKKKKKEIDDRKDDLIWFEPPKNCNKIPRGHVPEWGFDASRTCLIPREGYNAGRNNKGKNKKSDEKKKTLAINALTACKGELMTFSFHVEALDQIRCYLYWMGQVMRFYPQDIIEVLPHLFDKNVFENDKFISTQIAIEIAKKTKIHDFAFEQFYRACSGLTEKDFPKYSILAN